MFCRNKFFEELLKTRRHEELPFLFFVHSISNLFRPCIFKHSWSKKMWHGTPKFVCIFGTILRKVFEIGVIQIQPWKNLINCREIEIPVEILLQFLKNTERKWFRHVYYQQFKEKTLSTWPSFRLELSSCSFQNLEISLLWRSWEHLESMVSKRCVTLWKRPEWPSNLSSKKRESIVLVARTRPTLFLKLMSLV